MNPSASPETPPPPDIFPEPNETAPDHDANQFSTEVRSESTSHGDAADHFPRIPDLETGRERENDDVVTGETPFHTPVVPDEEILILPSRYYPVKRAAPPIFRALAKRKRLFVHAGRIVEYVETTPGYGLLMPLTPAGLASRVEHAGMILKHVVGKDGKVVLKPDLCSKSIAEILLATCEALELLPPLALLSNTPVLVVDTGKPIVLGNGYHPHLGGILVMCRENPVDVPLNEAVASILKILKDFLFETPSDLARAVAMLLTIAMVDGGLFRGEHVPLFVLEANQSQSGKGYLASLAAAIFKQDPPPLSPRRGGVGSPDEDFDAALLRAFSCILLDNIRGRLDSTHIESFFTAGSVFLCRVPHRPNLPVDPRRYVVFLTSNGFVTSPDLENRILRIRIQKRPADHHFAWYPQGHVLKHVREKNAYYHSCLLSILKEWVAQGCLETRESRHDFRGWARPVDWIIRHIFKDVITGRLLDEPHKATDLGSAEKLGFNPPPEAGPAV